MIDSQDWNIENKYFSTGTELDALVEKFYPNPLENDTNYTVCPNCGERLYDGDTYYPRIGLCEYCLPDYKEKVEIEQGKKRTALPSFFLLNHTTNISYAIYPNWNCVIVIRRWCSVC